jgi:hypothetical protein
MKNGENKWNTAIVKAENEEIDDFLFVNLLPKKRNYLF